MNKEFFKIWYYVMSKTCRFDSPQVPNSQWRTSWCKRMWSPLTSRGLSEVIASAGLRTPPDMTAEHLWSKGLIEPRDSIIRGFLYPGEGGPGTDSPQILRSNYKHNWTIRHSPGKWKNCLKLLVWSCFYMGVMVLTIPTNLVIEWILLMWLKWLLNSQFFTLCSFYLS